MSKLPASASRLRPPSSKQSKKETPAPPVAEKKLDFSLPAFSVPSEKKKQAINFEKLRKQAIRRQAPQGEDINEIKRVLKDIKGQKLTVLEFINLVAPHTADNGQCLRLVLEDELKSFKQLAKKVYETMTKDVSDVLANEQLQLREFYDDRIRLLNDKMMQFIDELFCMIPEFDFEQFLMDPDTYLSKNLKIPEELAAGDEVVEMHRRQMAYHRLQWLRTEEERLNEENAKLLSKLNELKREQQLKREQAEQIAQAAENERQQLIAQETAAREQLETLNNSMERSVIQTETAINLQENAEKAKSLLKTNESKKSIAKEKKKGALRKRKMDWVSTAASELEENAQNEARAAATGAIKRSRGRSPHFSPIKTPPSRVQPKSTSPFHYSPPSEHFESPPTALQRERSPPIHMAPPMRQVHEATVTAISARQQPTGRRNLAPRDTWGGF